MEVQALTETVLLVLMPGSGDSIQALKAGLMEIPDLLVINKADRPGADLLRAELEATLSLVPSGPWRPPIVSTRSIDGEGVAELWTQVGRHREFLAGEGRLRERRRDGMARQLRALAVDRLARGVDAAARAGLPRGPDRAGARSRHRPGHGRGPGARAGQPAVASRSASAAMSRTPQPVAVPLLIAVPATSRWHQGRPSVNSRRNWAA